MPTPAPPAPGPAPTLPPLKLQLSTLDNDGCGNATPAPTPPAAAMGDAVRPGLPATPPMHSNELLSALRDSALLLNGLVAIALGPLSPLPLPLVPAPRLPAPPAAPAPRLPTPPPPNALAPLIGTLFSRSRSRSRAPVRAPPTPVPIPSPTMLSPRLRSYPDGGTDGTDDAADPPLRGSTKRFVDSRLGALSRVRGGVERRYVAPGRARCPGEREGRSVAPGGARALSRAGGRGAGDRAARKRWDELIPAVPAIVVPVPVGEHERVSGRERECARVPRWGRRIPQACVPCGSAVGRGGGGGATFHAPPYSAVPKAYLRGASPGSESEAELDVDVGVRAEPAGDGGSGAADERDGGLAGAVGQLSLNEDKQVRYHGKASGLHLLARRAAVGENSNTYVFWVVVTNTVMITVFRHLGWF
ncbi:hypothetical protein B0H11DRAFT_2243083 [Mycena galericulata]|nr:hypothetical protein B0H11DRAFT_2243083 [Mycena galericulata]